MVGTALTSFLTGRGHSVIILSRRRGDKTGNGAITYMQWDIKMQTIDPLAITGADYIIHLAGASVFAKRWTKKYKKEIENSRVQSSRLLLQALRTYPHKIKAIVSSSATGWYGADKNAGQAFTEDDAPADDFLGQVCMQWEQSINEASSLGIPVIKLRTGIVLSNKGGFLEPLKKALRFGIAAIPGNGRQIISWIHIEDLCRMFLFAAEKENIEGSFNAVASMPVSMKALSIQYAGSLNKKFIAIYIPAFVLRVLLGSRSVETTKSVTVSNTLAKSKGFQFLYPSVDAALQALATDRS